MPDLNNLNLNPKDVDFDAIPDNFGATFVVPPQPGLYRFALPSAHLLEKSFEVFKHDEQGERLRVIFQDETALRNLTLDNLYNIRLSNVGRIITPKNRPAFVINDLALLLKAVESIPTENTTAGYKAALLGAAEREFMAENTLTATCNPARDTYAFNEATGRSEPRPGIKGCGQKFRVEGYTGRDGKPVLAMPRDEHGKVYLRFTCRNCDADVRAWGTLQGFKAIR